MATNQPVTPPLDLLKETVRQIGQQYKDRVYQFRKGHDIITQSHSGVECYLIIDGHVNVYAKGDDGKTTILFHGYPMSLLERPYWYSGIVHEQRLFV